MVEIRIAICEQMGCLVFLATSVRVTVVALATWYTNYEFVLDVRCVELKNIAARG